MTYNLKKFIQSMLNLNANGEALKSDISRLSKELLQAETKVNDLSAKLNAKEEQTDGLMQDIEIISYLCDEYKSYVNMCKSVLSSYQVEIMGMSIDLDPSALPYEYQMSARESMYAQPQIQKLITFKPKPMGFYFVASQDAVNKIVADLSVYDIDLTISKHLTKRRKVE